MIFTKINSRLHLAACNDVMRTKTNNEPKAVSLHFNALWVFCTTSHCTAIINFANVSSKRGHFLQSHSKLIYIAGTLTCFILKRIECSLRFIN